MAGDTIVGQIASSDVVLTRVQDNLMITAASDGEMLVQICDFFDNSSGDYVVDHIVFSDTTIDQSSIAGMTDHAITGTSGNDTLSGDVYSSTDFDSIAAGAGNDVLIGDGGTDSLMGEDGNDSLDGGVDGVMDHLWGGNGNDFYTFGIGYGQDFIFEQFDTLDGGNSDTLQLVGLTPNDVTFDRVDTFVYGYFLSSNLKISVTGHSDAVFIESQLPAYGDPTGVTLAQIEHFIFDDGTDWSADDMIALVNGNRPASNSNDTLTGTSLSDDQTFNDSTDPQHAINGLLGNDIISMGAGNDQADGGGDNDTVYGEAGNDTLYGGAGADSVDGGGDDDIMIGGAGNDTMIGGAGNDLMTGSDYDTGTGLFTSTSDTESLVGNAGDDIFVVLNASTTVVEASSEGTDSVYENVASYTLGSNIENVYAADLASSPSFAGALFDAGKGTSVAVTITGNSLDNLIVGNELNNSLIGSGGNDTIYGQTGNDTMIGGTGDDKYIVDSGSDLVTENSSEGTDLIESSVTWTLANNIENLTLTGTSGLSGTGNSLGNYIIGNSGNNSINGSTGWDTLDGGTGDDTLTGGIGSDVLIVDSSADVVNENSGEGTDTVQSSVAWTLGTNFENLTLTGSSNIDGTGNSVANVMTGNAGNNSLYGDAGNDSIVAGAGNDSIDGGTGDDTMRGGAGDDVFYSDSTSDAIYENASEGNDTVVSSVTRTLGSNIENLTLTGSSNIDGTGNGAANVITGNSGNNSLNGGAGGADTIDGGAGDDTMVGGIANDTYIVDSAGDVITENAGEGTDDVQSSVSYTLSNYVENMTLTGSSNINGSGNSIANDIFGNSGDNSLFGDAANDSIDGGAGNDTLDGGSGIDTMSGGAGDDVYYVDAASDSALENASEGTDIVYSAVTRTIGNNIENMTLTGSSNINSTGNSLDNIINGNSGNNTLSGVDGNDSLFGDAGTDSLVGGNGNDTLDGGTGNDTLKGGVGDDVYYIDSTSDSISENSGEGTDTVYSTVTKTLSGNFENLTLVGSGSIDGTGTTTSNVMLGGTGDNSLNAAGGNDTLDGGAGADTLTGGSGADMFQFTATLGSSGVDVITDFASGSDWLQIDNDLTNLSETGTLDSSRFANNTAGTGDVRFIYDTTTGALYYDADGNGSGSAVQFATLSTHPSIAYTDFTLV